MYVWIMYVMMYELEDPRTISKCKSRVCISCRRYIPDPQALCQAQLSRDGLFARGYSTWTHAIGPYIQIFKPAHHTEKQIKTTACLTSQSNTVIRNAIINLTVPNIFWFFSVGKHFYQYFLKYTQVWLGMIATIIKGIKTLLFFFSS